MIFPSRWRFERAEVPIRLRDAGDELDAVLASGGATESSRYAARLVVEEVVLNVLEHGGAAWVTVEAAPDGESIRLDFEDDGGAFDPTEPPASTVSRGPDDVPPRGRGLSLLRAMARSVTYRRRGDRNVLSIVLGDGSAGHGP